MKYILPPWFTDRSRSVYEKVTAKNIFLYSFSSPSTVTMT